MRNRQDAVRGGGAELLRGHGRQNLSASRRGEPFELRILEAEGGDAGLKIDAAGAEDAEIGRNLLHIPQGLGAERAAGLPVHHAADQDDTDGGFVDQRRGNRRRIGRSRQFEFGRQGIGNRQIGAAGIEEHRQAGGDLFCCCPRQCLLPVGGNADALRQAAMRRRDRQGAAIDSLAESRRRHLAKVAPHRIFGDAEFERKLRRQHAAVQPQPLGNHPLALSQQKILHVPTGSLVEVVKTCINVYDRADNMHSYTFSEAMKQCTR
ncbi:hypothetical protein RHECNPAF_280094 [Rhizobium etli CNPAF512]|nr:hypothetical protein RHECNPAF_280094 [Rhizobium etli CNPAF512]